MKLKPKLWLRCLLMHTWCFIQRVAPWLRKYFLALPSGGIKLADIVGVEILSTSIVPALTLHAPINIGVSSQIFANGQEPAFNEYLAIIPRGIVFSDYGYVMTSDDSGIIKLVEELVNSFSDMATREFYLLEKYNWRLLNRIQYISGTVAVINSSVASHNYFHWMIDAVPRFRLLESWRDKIDYYFVSSEQTYHKELLKSLNIPAEKIINPGINTTIKAYKLLVPSLPFITSCQKDIIKSMNRGNYSNAGFEYLRNLFPLTQKKTERKLYISRRDSNTRLLQGEDMLIEKLAHYGFEIIVTGEMSVSEQAKAFSEASVVCACHGAGLANLVFSQHGTRVIDMMPHSHIANFYFIMSAIRQLDYSYVILPELKNEMMQMNEDKLDEILQLLN